MITNRWLAIARNWRVEEVVATLTIAIILFVGWATAGSLVNFHLSLGQTLEATLATCSMSLVTLIGILVWGVAVKGWGLVDGL